jgi:hypothetical protein
MVDIEITIRRKKRKSAIKSGPLAPRRDADYLPRRKGAIKINVYDIGEYWNGSAWVDNTGLIQTPSVTAGAVGFSGKVSRDVDYYDWASALSTVQSLGGSLSNWKNVFRRLDLADGGKKGIDVTIDGTSTYALAAQGSRNFVITHTTWNGTEFTDEGLKLKRPHESIAFQNVLGFVKFNTAETGDLKITETPDYSDPEVPFTLKKDTDFFLMPAINFWHKKAEADYIGGGPLPNWIDEDSTPIIYAPFSREYFMHDPTFVTAAGPYFFANDPLDNPGFELWNSWIRDAVMNWAMGRSGVSAFFTRTKRAGGSATLTDTLTHSAAGWPMLGSSSGVQPVEYSIYGEKGVAHNEIGFVGAFLGAAVQGSDTFYFWNKVPGGVSSIGNGFVAFWT